MSATVVIRLLALAGCMAAAQAHAQTAPAVSRLGALRRVSGACQAETVRFCPALTQLTPNPREQYICLKDYKTSLSFNCRSAIKGVAAR